MQQKVNQRIVYFDLLRVLAAFAVILLHVASREFKTFFFSPNWNAATVYNSLSRWGVPMFVMISGALFLNPRREITYKEILIKRIPRLLLAYVFWVVVYALNGFVMKGFDGFTIRRLLRQVIVAPRSHLWFLPMLMGVYLLIPILRKIAQDNKLMRYALLIWMVFVFVSFFQYAKTFELVTQFYPLFKMNIIVGYSGYFLLGYFLSCNVFSKKQRIWIYLLGIVGLLVAIFGTFYISISIGKANNRYLDRLSLQVMATAAALFVLMKELAPRYGKLTLKLVAFVRKDLFGIYLVHLLWLPIVNTAEFRYCCSGIITIPLITIIVFVLSLFTTKLIRLIPILRKVVE